MSEFSFGIPTSNGYEQIPIKDGRALFILGRNGTGKSALIHYISNQFRARGTNKVIYLPGSRPSYFDSDSLNMNANARSQFEINSVNWDASPDVRIRPIAGTSRNERAIYDLQAAEIQYRVEAANQIEIEGPTSSAIARLQSKSSPLDRVNRLLQQANMPITTKIDSGEIKAVRDSSTYSISKMSDGERMSLIIIADVIAAKPGSILLIDEPELHLHRAIVVPLLSSLLKERPDCTVIISTHELGLVNDHPDSSVILVRGCNWAGSNPSAWTIDVLQNADCIPEDVRVDLLGSRQLILFIEGTKTSRDQQLYAILFPKVSLRHRSSCIDVRRSVVGLRSIESLHHTKAFGLVDNDGMNLDFQRILKDEGIYALPIFSVESLYYASEVIVAVATRQGATLDIKPEELVASAKEKALFTLRGVGKKEHLAARIAERQMRDILLKQIPDRSTMIRSAENTLNISVPSPYPSVIARLEALLEAGDLETIIAGFPIRESGILSEIAKALHFVGDVDYEKAALAIISTNLELAASLRAKLGDLATLLQ